MKYKEYPETQRFLCKNPQISFFHSHKLETHMNKFNCCSVELFFV